MLQTDFFICGLAPFRDVFQYILLCYEKSEVKIFRNIIIFLTNKKDRYDLHNAEIFYFYL